jgi:hypothetical protein
MMVAAPAVKPKGVASPTVLAPPMLCTRSRPAPDREALEPLTHPGPESAPRPLNTGRQVCNSRMELARSNACGSGDRLWSMLPRICRSDA